MLLNVGPKADGSIAEQDTHILKEIGAWLKINGDGIYNTRPWRIYGEGPTELPEGYFSDTKRKGFTRDDYRYTFKPGCVYAFCMSTPDDGIYRLKTIAKSSKRFKAVISNVKLLGQEDNCKFIQGQDYLTIISNPQNTNKPTCLKISFD